jgi:hypothetical protein
MRERPNWIDFSKKFWQVGYFMEIQEGLKRTQKVGNGENFDDLF